MTQNSAQFSELPNECPVVISLASTRLASAGMSTSTGSVCESTLWSGSRFADDNAPPTPDVHHLVRRSILTRIEDEIEGDPPTLAIRVPGPDPGVDPRHQGLTTREHGSQGGDVHVLAHANPIGRDVAHDLEILPLFLRILGIEHQLQRTGPVPVVAEPVLGTLELELQPHLVPTPAVIREVHLPGDAAVVFRSEPVEALSKARTTVASSGRSPSGHAVPRLIGGEVDPIALTLPAARASAERPR